MLLIHNDHPDLLHRGKHRRSGTDNDIDLFKGDFAPLVQPFARGEHGMNHSDFFAESGPEPPFCL